jgi:hypothetical protein
MKVTLDISKISGLTLYRRAQGGWQLSVRPVGEEGWACHDLSDKQADDFIAEFTFETITEKRRSRIKFE